MSLLSIRNLSVSYGKVVALDDVSLEVRPGELVALVGANGAGKSTLMKTIMRLVRLTAGTVEFEGNSLLRREAHEIARLGIAYVPEGRGTLGGLSVRENLRLGAFSRRWNEETRRDFEQVIARFPILGERINQHAGTLSGGEQQMLVIGRALMSRPRLLLLDEPSLGLAPLIAQRIFEIVQDLNKLDVAILLVEQNAHAALKLAQRAYVLEMGRIVLQGTDLAQNQKVRDAYLGSGVGA
jgi:branched-chain amino acid transport system ATP-binding protein